MKILLIRFKMIGDVLLTSSIGNSLRASFPDAQIDYLMYDNAAPLFEQTTVFNHIHSLSRRERQNPIRYLWRLWQISRNDYDVIIDTAGTAKSEFMCWFSLRSKYRIGRKKPGRGFAYSHRISKQELPVNKIAQRLAMLTPLRTAGLKIVEGPPLKVDLTSEETGRMRELMASKGINFEKTVVAVALSARDTTKQWSFERMRDLIRHLTERYDLQIILIAGLPHERKDVAKMHFELNNPSNVFAGIETHSLRELAAQLKCCTLFIGNEGGPRHIADAVGLPSLAIVAPSTAKSEWLRADSDRHKSIEWRDIDPAAHEGSGSISVDDPKYQLLFDLIEVRHVAKLAAQLVETATEPQQSQSRR